MYVVDEKKINENIAKIKLAFYVAGVNLTLAYSYKTNSMEEVLDVIRKNPFVCHEVVSEREHKLAEKDRRKPIICNGVEMSYEQLAKHLKDGDIVNFNDMTSVRKVNDLLTEEEKKNALVGLRIGFDDSRFGVKKEDVASAVAEIRSYGMDLICLHCHVSGTRGKEKFRKKIADMVDVIIDNSIAVDFIDFGGNLYGEMDDEFARKFDDVCSFIDYAEIVRDETARLEYKPFVILECGTAIIANAVSVRAKVIKIDEYNRAVLDYHKYVFGNVFSRKPTYTIYHIDKNNAVQDSYKVYGCTCMEDDVIIPEYFGCLSEGDEIEFCNCGAYTNCLEPEFIIDRQEVIVK